MSTATLQIRVEDSLKEQAMALFERLGLDLPTAVRIFLKKSVAENGVPFEIKEKPVLPNLQFGRREYQHLQCGKTTICGCRGTTALQGRV